MAHFAATSENAFTLLARFVDAFDWEWSEDEKDRSALLQAAKELLHAQGYWEAASLDLRAFTLQALETKILAHGHDVETVAIQHVAAPGNYVLASPGILSLNVEEPSLKQLIAAINRGHDRHFNSVTNALHKEISRLNDALAKVRRTETLDRTYIKQLREYFRIPDKKRF